MTVEKLDDHIFRLDQIQIDTAKHELTVPGHVNDAYVLEFVACTRGGLKAYESALTIDTNGIALNTALILIGLDKAHARVPTRHFDPNAPAGDPVDIFIEWMANGKKRRERIEEMLLDLRIKQPLPNGPWVYTGSTLMGGPPGAYPRYMADQDGVLIGFVHSPSPLIENPRAGGVDGYGAIVMNRNLGLAPDTPVTLIIKALPIAASAPR